jgi:2,3-dihydroxybenzoate decarboxylase
MRWGEYVTTDRRKFLQSSLALPTIASGPALAADAPPRTSSQPQQRFRRIAVEETFATLEFLDARAKLLDPQDSMTAAKLNPLQKKLVGLGASRIADMDAAGVDVQIVSLYTRTGQLPSNTATGIMQRANDVLAQAVHANPTRLGGLIAVMPQNIGDAVKEIERGAKKLKLNGAIINSTTHNEYLDDPKYLPILEALVEHDLSLYLHPSDPPKQMIGSLDIPGYNTGWSFGADAGTHAVRIMAAGIFDRLPKLRLVLGHMGESVPFWIDRIDDHYPKEFTRAQPSKLQKKPSEYLRENVYVTTSGMNWWPQLRMTQEIMGPDHVLFALDYPFEDDVTDTHRVDAMPMNDADKHKFYHANAEKIFKIQAV